MRRASLLPAALLAALLAAPPAGADGAGRPRIAVVIDDLGDNLAKGRWLIHRSYPVTLAILPFTPYGRALAEEATGRGREVLIHLPMEAGAGGPAARGVIRHGASPGEIIEAIRAARMDLPSAAGVNNHMGSLATSDPEIMRPLLAEIHRMGLFFLDSRTTAHSVAPAIAVDVKVPMAQRRVFLDHEPAFPAVARQMDELFRRARREGEAVAIGHPFIVTLAAMEAFLPGASQEFELVTVSALAR